MTDATRFHLWLHHFYRQGYLWTQVREQPLPYLRAMYAFDEAFGKIEMELNETRGKGVREQHEKGDLLSGLGTAPKRDLAR